MTAAAIKEQAADDDEMPDTPELLAALKAKPVKRVRKIYDATRGFSLAMGALCLDEASAHRAKLATEMYETKLRADAQGQIDPITVIPVTFFGTPMFANVITGSLYEATSGRCLTGRLTLVHAESVQPRKKRPRVAVKSPRFNNQRVKKT